MRILGRLQSRKQSRNLSPHPDNKCTDRNYSGTLKSIEGLQTLVNFSSGSQGLLITLLPDRQLCIHYMSTLYTVLKSG